MRIAAVLAVHGDAPHVLDTLVSIAAQDRPVDERIAVADAITEEVRTLLEAHGFHIVNATTTAMDPHTRVAHNFSQGVALATACDLAVLGDHDDVWHRHRVRHHEQVANEFPDAAMLVSDGRLVNATGEGMGSTLRMTFPVPVEWNDMSTSAQWRYAIRHSIATGGASAVRPKYVAAQQVPPGWLHDRWWSLAAIRRGGIVIDDVIVIDYRITDEQQVGLDTQGQHDALAWLTNKAGNAGRTVKRMRDLSSLMRS